jgi:ubiquitin conjugation factor E4 B
MSDVNLASFAEGINYTLDSLVSPKGLKIKISNPKEYFFEPKEITEELVQWYAFMGQYQKFVDQVVLDSRSYRELNFVKVRKLIKKFKVKVSGNQGKEFTAFIEKCKDAFEENKLKATFMDDAPDEFVDELFCVLMENPVRIPSGNIVDLNQLKKHLMNDSTDPYTRAPMQLEDAESMPELKARIDEFREEKLQAFRIEKDRRQKEAEEDNDMDIDDLDNFE